MSKQEPKEVNELLEIWNDILIPLGLQPHHYSKDVIINFWHLKAKMDGYKQEIQDLTEEIQSIEDIDPFENYEPQHDESRD